MTDNNRNSIDGKIDELVGTLGSYPPGSVEFKSSIADIEKLAKASSDDYKVRMDAYIKETQATNGAELGKRKLILDGVKIGGAIVVTVWQTCRITKFEEVGVITSKVLGLIPKNLLK